MTRYLFSTFSYNAFQAFLREERSEENVIFWQKCEQYRKSTDAAYRKQLARLIYANHVAESSADQVNIDADVRQTVERRLSTAAANLYDDAQRHVYLLMKYDPYPRFLRSRAARDAPQRRHDRPKTENSTDDRPEVPPEPDARQPGGGGGGLLSRLRQRLKAVKASSRWATTKDDSGHGTSLSSFGSDDAEHSAQSGSVDEATAAVTPTSLLDRLLRRLPSTKSARHDPSSTPAEPGSAPAARRRLFDRWRRTDDESDARSVASARTAPAVSPRRRQHTGQRRLSVPTSHLVRRDSDQRRRFAAVMARLAAAGGDARSVTAASGNDDPGRHRQGLAASIEQRSGVTDDVRRHYRRYLRRTRSKSADAGVEFTVYFV